MIARLPARAALLAVLAVLLWPLASAGAASEPGAPDAGFGSGGSVALGAGTQLLAVAIVPGSGEIVATGQAGGSLLVECLSASGTPVGAGQYVGGAGVGQGVAIAPDGSAVVGGTSGGIFAQRFDPVSCQPAGARMTAGALGPGAVAAGVAVGESGEVVLAGTVPHADPTGNSTRPALAVFNPDGSPDSGFGSGGTEVIDHGNAFAVATAVSVQPDGRILLAGYWEATLNVPNGWVERLLPSGADDPSFAGGSGVYQYYSHGAGRAELNALALEPNGDILAAGFDDAGPSAVFVRLSPAGAPDASFGGGGDGSTRLPSGTFTPNPYGAYAVGLAGGGRVVGAGAMYENGASDAAVWALTPAGAPDGEGAFGSSATVQQSGSEACGLAVAPDGGLVLVGSQVSPTRSQNVNPCSRASGAPAFVERLVGFGAPPAPASGSSPTATTLPASDIGRSSATLNGEVDPGGLATSYHFQYGTGTAYAHSTPEVTLPAGSATTEVAAQLAQLSPGTSYHYRLVASNAAGQADGADRVLTTAAGGPPVVQTGGAADVRQLSATLTGTVDPQGLASSYRFQYGTRRSYGRSTRLLALATAGGPVTVSAVLRGLRPGTTYYYRLLAANADGTAAGPPRRFTTARSTRPAVSTGAARAITGDAATLSGRIDPEGLRTSYSFQYAAAGGHGEHTRTFTLPAGEQTVTVTVHLSGLRPGARYSFRLVARNARGASDGARRFFTIRARRRRAGRPRSG